MTRRDYCGNCYNMVNDDDPQCIKCGISFCIDCFEPYDELSKLYKLQFRFMDFNRTNGKNTSEYILDNLGYFEEFISNKKKKYIDVLW